MNLISMLQDKNLLIRSILCNYITSQHLLLEEVLPKSYFTSTMLQSCNLSKFVFGNSQYSSLDRMYVVTVKKSKIIILYMFFCMSRKAHNYVFQNHSLQFLKNYLLIFQIPSFHYGQHVWKVLIHPLNI